MTNFIQSIVVADGYNGHTRRLMLCHCPEANVFWAVWSGGYFRFADSRVDCLQRVRWTALYGIEPTSN